MNITLNDKNIELPGNCLTIQDLLQHQGIMTAGTAVSVNDRIVRHADWPRTGLAEGDRVVIISAAFGG